MRKTLLALGAATLAGFAAAVGAAPAPFDADRADMAVGDAVALEAVSEADDSAADSAAPSPKPGRRGWGFGSSRGLDEATANPEAEEFFGSRDNKGEPVHWRKVAGPDSEPLDIYGSDYGLSTGGVGPSGIDEAGLTRIFRGVNDRAVTGRIAYELSDDVSVETDGQAARPAQPAKPALSPNYPPAFALGRPDLRITVIPKDSMHEPGTAKLPKRSETPAKEVISYKSSDLAAACIVGQLETRFRLPANFFATYDHADGSKTVALVNPYSKSEGLYMDIEPSSVGSSIRLYANHAVLSTAWLRMPESCK